MEGSNRPIPDIALDGSCNSHRHFWLPFSRRAVCEHFNMFGLAAQPDTFSALLASANISYIVAGDVSLCTIHFDLDDE
jgi:hypothetical protein